MNNRNEKKNRKRIRTNHIVMVSGEICDAAEKLAKKHGVDAVYITDHMVLTGREEQVKYKIVPGRRSISFKHNAYTRVCPPKELLRIVEICGNHDSRQTVGEINGEKALILNAFTDRDVLINNIYHKLTEFAGGFEELQKNYTVMIDIEGDEEVNHFVCTYAPDLFSTILRMMDTATLSILAGYTKGDVPVKVRAVPLNENEEQSVAVEEVEITPKTKGETHD